MVKINYSWNAEIPNTGPHADNDTKSVRRRETARERERVTWDRSKGVAQLPPIDRLLI